MHNNIIINYQAKPITITKIIEHSEDTEGTGEVVECGWCIVGEWCWGMWFVQLSNEEEETDIVKLQPSTTTTTNMHIQPIITNTQTKTNSIGQGCIALSGNQVDKVEA